MAVSDPQGQQTSVTAARHESEALFRSIFEHAAMGIERVAVDGRLLMVSAALCRMLGYSECELLNKTCEEITCPEDRDGETPLLEAMLRGERESYEIEKRYLHRDGSFVWVHLTSSPVNSAEGKPLYRISIIQNITERKQAEEAVQASQTRYRELAESIPTLLWATGAQGVTTDHNRRWHEYTGVPPGQGNRDHWKEFVFPDDLQRVSERWQYSVRTGEDYSIESRLRRASDGAYRWHAVQASLRRDEQGNPLGWFGTFIDIEDRKRAEQEREITIEFLELVNRSRGTRDLIQRATTFFQKCSGCEAVGIRLREGDDFPYFEARGFSKEFVLLENKLCARDGSGEIVRDSPGNPVIECICGNVICGLFEPSKPFLTVQGSFWSNSTSELLGQYH
jgi:PAS domain S-box-containing protein